MIGESTIEAAARRGLARQRLREHEFRQGRHSGYPGEDDGRSRATMLVPQNINVRDSGTLHDGGRVSESMSVLNAHGHEEVRESSTALEVEVQSLCVGNPLVRPDRLGEGYSDGCDFLFFILQTIAVNN